MAIGTFSELKTAIANWIDRDDLTNRIPEFISIAEAKINRILRIQAMETNVDITINSGTASLPTGFRAAKIFYLDRTPRVTLLYLSPHRLNERELGLNNTGVPSHFTYEGDTFRFRPEPADSETGKLTYYKSFTALSDSNPTTTLLTNHPDVYLYGALAEAGPFLIDTELTALYTSLFSSSLTQIQSEDKKNRISGSELVPRARSATP